MIDVLHQLLKSTVTYLVHWLKQLIEKSITVARKKKDIRHKISSASEATQLDHQFCSISPLQNWRFSEIQQHKTMNWSGLKDNCTSNCADDCITSCTWCICCSTLHLSSCEFCDVDTVHLSWQEYTSISLACVILNKQTKECISALALCQLEYQWRTL
jgi:hypothetical protein